MDFENIYIHVPFCSTKCDYCGFYSVPNPCDSQLEIYLKRIEKELKQLKLSHPVSTLYFGGGTPSLLGPKKLKRMIEAVKRFIPLTPDAEVSMECNPETLDRERLDIIGELVNRFSIGVQSFDNTMLERLGRNATRKHIEHTLELLKEYGKENINLDLIYCIPGQTIKDWLEELRIAVEANAKHLSCYSLTLEEGTALAKKIGSDISPIDEDVSAEMWEQAGSFLDDRGIKRYEVSNYSAPGAECSHNMNVWYGRPYLGLGPAASSFDGRVRWTQPYSLEDWADGAPPEKDIIDPEYRMIEIFIIGLRTVNGWSKELWESVPLQNIVQVDWDTMLVRAFKVKRKYPELLAADPESIRLTSRGLLFWNTIAEAWLE
jgi:oxygen-independent coproporphyrinogen-3 oxidase